MSNEKKHPVIEKFIKWKADHLTHDGKPAEDYYYDEIHEFLADLSRSEMLDFMEWAQKLSESTALFFKKND